MCWASPVGAPVSSPGCPSLAPAGCPSQGPHLLSPASRSSSALCFKGAGLGLGSRPLFFRAPVVYHRGSSPSPLQAPLGRSCPPEPLPTPTSCAYWVGLSARTQSPTPSPQLKARCELQLDWSTLSLENLLKEKQALKSQISEKQRHCLELQVRLGWGLEPSSLPRSHSLAHLQTLFPSNCSSQHQTLGRFLRDL